MATELQLGTRIRSLRQARHLTLRDVAERAGVTESFLSQVERDVTSPSIARCIPSTAVTGPNRFVTPWISTSGAVRRVDAAPRPGAAASSGRASIVGDAVNGGPRAMVRASGNVL